jgi:hypothetical protein
VPVAAEVGRLAGDGDHVADADLDGPVAPRADVALAGLEGVHGAHVVVVGVDAPILPQGGRGAGLGGGVPT